MSSDNSEDFHAELARRLQALRDAGSGGTDQNERLLELGRGLRAQIAQLEAEREASEWLRATQAGELQQVRARLEELESLFDALAMLLAEPGADKPAGPIAILGQVAARLSAFEKEKAESQGLITRLSHNLALQQVDDDLDDAASRRNALRRLDEAVERGGKAKAPLFCLFIELESQESLKAKSGSIAADFVLVQVAHRLKLGLRRRDVLLRYDTAAFVLLTGDASAEQAYLHAQRLFGALGNDPVELGTKKLTPQIRIGIVGTAGKKSADDILRAAKALLKKGKNLPEPIVIDPALVKKK